MRGYPLLGDFLIVYNFLVRISNKTVRDLIDRLFELSIYETLCKYSIPNACEKIQEVYDSVNKLLRSLYKEGTLSYEDVNAIARHVYRSINETLACRDVISKYGPNYRSNRGAMDYIIDKYEMDPCEISTFNLKIAFIGTIAKLNKYIEIYRLKIRGP